MLDETESPLKQLAVSLNISIAMISAVLISFMRFDSPVTSALKRLDLFSNLSEAEIADRVSVIILLASSAIIFLFLPTFQAKIKKDSVVKFVATISLGVLILSMSWQWGDPLLNEYEEVLWFGWGDKFALLILATALITVYLISLNKNFFDIRFSNLTKIVNYGSWIVIFCYYLPSAIQPFKGIIDQYHSRYFLNDLLIVASGSMPFSDLSPQYVGILGFPIKLLTFLPNDVVVNSALVWVNFLVLAEIFFLALVTKRALKLDGWATALLIPIAIIFVKVQPNIHSQIDSTYRRAWGSIAQHMSTIPGRSVFPIVLLVLVSEFATRKESSAKSKFAFLVGIFIVYTAFNNFEFGVPASIAALIIVFFLAHNRIASSREIRRLFLGLMFGLTTIIIVYLISDSRLTLSNWLLMVRAHGFDGFANLAMPRFGLWIFFYSVLGSSAIIGCHYFFRVLKVSKPDPHKVQSVILLTFGGLWGSATFFYYSGRSLVPEIVPSLIPLSMCVVGFAGLVRSIYYDSVSLGTDRSIFEGAQFAFAPLLCVLLIPLASLTQAPNPSFEWLRMAGAGDKWSSREIRRMEKYQKLIELRDQKPNFKFVYMGNDGPAISIMSDVDNGLGIILIKDLLINDDVRDFGCQPALNSGAEVALVPKIDWDVDEIPCPGFTKFEPEADSPFLFFQIPSKVSP
jgi:hypothetical protein